MKLGKLPMLLAVAAGAWAPATFSTPLPVALELALLVDVSFSVGATEYGLQKTGYALAFESDVIQNLIAQLPGGIAVAYIEWSGKEQQALAVPWRHIGSDDAADAFAATIRGLARSFPPPTDPHGESGQTYPGYAIDYGALQISNNDFAGARTVIDVSGDGTSNLDDHAAFASFAAVNGGGVTTINGLSIGGTTLKLWYDENIARGPHHFVVAATDFESFQDAVAVKLAQELDPTPRSVPEPATMALLGLGVLGLALGRRRR